MKKIIIIICLLLTVTIIGMQKTQFPQTDISNGIIKARLYLPDPRQGYYRGTRFDWAGVISSLEYKGHNYFGQWFEKYSPTIHDAIMGPVDSFTPAGYSEALPGGTFLKIGVGILSKPDDTPYGFSKNYDIVNTGEWKIKTRPDNVRFVHILNDKEYSYEYEKEVQLLKDKPVLVLTHRLTNRGKRPIETDVYNHNFFMINNQPTGPGFTVEFPFNLTGEFRNGADIAEIHNNMIILRRELARGETIYCGKLEGFSDSNKDYDIKVENHKTGAGVRITCDCPLSKIVFWSCPTTLCPEPYIQIKVEPGKEFSWKIFYEFYTVPTVPGS